jgi:phosphate starvation-inducible PhoH-like protein
MGKKKNLQTLDEDEMAYVQEKMAPDTENTKEYINYLKTLSYKISIKCKNEKQKDFLNILKDKTKKIIFANGSPGTGKSWLSDSYALHSLKNNEFEKIIICTPLIQSTSMPIGILPGTLQEKVYMHELNERRNFSKILKESGNINSEFISNALFNTGKISFEFVNYLRGMTIDNALILVAEAEKFSVDDMLLILTRMGENSKIIISGDELQVDRNDIKKNQHGSGLRYAMSKLSSMESVGCVTFDENDVVRNTIITEILKKWNE